MSAARIGLGTMLLLLVGHSSVDGARPDVDPRFQSPRATVRTFLISMNLAEEDPTRIEDAIACLDLSNVPIDRRGGGRYAFELEYILRSTNIPSNLVPDHLDSATCEIGQGEIRLRLKRMPDGRWLFDGDTIRDLSRMRLQLWERSAAEVKGKDTADVASEFRSPYAMYRTYAEALKSGNLDKAAECLDLTDVPGPARRIVGRELAYKLKEVLDRNLLIIPQDLPDSSAGLPLEAVVHRAGRITAERQAEGPRKGQWLFNRATVQSLDPLFEEFRSKPLLPELVSYGRQPRSPSAWAEPGLWIRERVPAPLTRRLAGAGKGSPAVYQWLGLALLALLAVPVFRITAGLAAWVLRRVLSWRRVEADDSEVSRWSRPIGWLAATSLLVAGVAALDLTLGTAGPLLAVLVPLRTLAATVAAYQLIDPLLRLAGGPHLAAEGASTFAAMGYPVVSLVLKLATVSLGAAVLLDLFQFDVGTVLAGLGIGGLAFALAAQDTLKNFFGSLMLIADKTFRVGDLVQIGGNEGVVESVGLRTTRIRGLDDSLLTIPNADLTTAHVTNFGARRFRRFRTQVTVPYGTPPDRLVEFRQAIVELLEKDANVNASSLEVAIHDLGSSGVEILVQAFLEVRDRRAELAARDRLILSLVRLADRLGVDPRVAKKDA